MSWTGQRRAFKQHTPVILLFLLFFTTYITPKPGLSLLLRKTSKKTYHGPLVQGGDPRSRGLARHDISWTSWLAGEEDVHCNR